MGSRETNGIPPFSRIFSEEEIILLEDYKRFTETAKEINTKKWVEFRKTCSLKQEYMAKQLLEKIQTMEKRFQKRKKSSPPADAHGACIFEISQSIWGDKVEDDSDIRLLEAKLQVKIQMVKEEIQLLKSEAEKENSLGHALRNLMMNIKEMKS